MMMAQTAWATWAQRRAADAPKIARQYEVEAAKTERMIAERGCSCDPVIDYDPSSSDPPVVMHALDCTNH